MQGGRDGQHLSVVLSIAGVGVSARGERLLGRGLLLLARKAVAADIAVAQLDSVILQLAAQHWQSGFQRRAYVAVRRGHLDLREVIFHLQRNVYLA